MASKSVEWSIVNAFERDLASSRSHQSKKELEVTHALPAVSYYLQPAHAMHLSGLAATRTHRTLFSGKPS